MNRVVLLASILVLASACGRKHRASADRAAPNESAPTSSQPLARAENAAPEGLRMLVDRLWTGELALSIEEHEDERVRLQRAIIVEQQVGDDWTRVQASEFTLRPDCATEAPVCVELTRGGALRPPPWSARIGKGQCTASTEGTRVPAGHYRFVVVTCEGGHRVASPPFIVQR